MMLRAILSVGMGGLLALPLPTRTGADHPGLAAQEIDREARIMAEQEREELQDWARRRLEALESGSEADFSGLPHAPEMERLWALYFLSVEEKAWEKPARALADTLADAELPEALHVNALAGALEVVRAKHSRWPPNKLKYLRRGVSALDRLVDEAPDDPVIRYLRLVSCFYLPFFLERDQSVKEDLQVLTEVLPRGSGGFSGPVYRAVIRFVLEHGDLDVEEQMRLEAALGDARASEDSMERSPWPGSELPLPRATEETAETG
jgi:hypothetical protein